jgi:hypothetical protein
LDFALRQRGPGERPKFHAGSGWLPFTKSGGHWLRSMVFSKGTSGTSSKRAFEMLAQCTKFGDCAIVASALPFIPALQKHHPAGHFTFVESPLQTKRTCIIGMFVLRPARKPLRRVASMTMAVPEQVYDERDWVYNIKGIDGGRPISDSSPVDGFRYVPLPFATSRRYR